MNGPSHSRNTNTASAHVLNEERKERFHSLVSLHTSAAWGTVPTLADSLRHPAQSWRHGSSGNASSRPDSRQSGSQDSEGSTTGSGSGAGGPQYASAGNGCARAEKAARTSGGVSARKSK